MEPPPAPSRETLDERGFLPHKELARVIAGRGFAAGTSRRVSGTLPDLAHLILALNLLGYEVRYDEAAGRVNVDAPVR